MDSLTCLSKAFKFLTDSTSSESYIEDNLITVELTIVQLTANLSNRWPHDSTRSIRYISIPAICHLYCSIWVL